jgi:hypothetical protein
MIGIEIIFVFGDRHLIGFAAGRGSGLGNFEGGAGAGGDGVRFPDGEVEAFRVGGEDAALGGIAGLDEADLAGFEVEYGGGTVAEVDDGDGAAALGYVGHLEHTVFGDEGGIAGVGVVEAGGVAFFSTTAMSLNVCGEKAGGGEEGPESGVPKTLCRLDCGELLAG